MRRTVVAVVLAGAFAVIGCGDVSGTSAVQSFCGNYAADRSGAVEQCMQRITAPEVCDRARDGDPDAVAAIAFSKKDCGS